MLFSIYKGYNYQNIYNIEVRNNYNNKTESLILTKYLKYPIPILDKPGYKITLLYSPLFKIYSSLYPKSTVVVLKK